MQILLKKLKFNNYKANYASNILLYIIKNITEHTEIRQKKQKKITVSIIKEIKQNIDLLLDQIYKPSISRITKPPHI